MTSTSGTTRAALVRAAMGSTAIAIVWLAGVSPAARPAVSAGVARPGEPVADPPSERHRIMADCLWPTARNHGFYELQHAALDTAAGAASSVATDGEVDAPGNGVAEHALWQSFLASTGTDTCGYTETDLAPLTRALAATRETAERHFAAPDTGVATRISRAVDVGR